MINPPKNIQSSPQEMYQLLQDITNHIISWAKPGMKMCELDEEARRMLGEYSEYFTHSLGHGVGIQIHESPRVSGKSAEILEPGMVITIEPGVYGIKIQNTSSSRHSRAPTRESISIASGEKYLGGDMDPRVIRPSKSQEGNSEHYGEREPEDDGLLSGVHEEPIYGLRYEEMVLIDKEKLIVL